MYTVKVYESDNSIRIYPGMNAVSAFCYAGRLLEHPRVSRVVIVSPRGEVIKDEENDVYVSVCIPK